MDTPYIFLIGGRDLEMAEIINILKSSDITYFDYHLDWDNAKLSAYSDVLNNYEQFVGIELKSDIDPPPNYLLVDHHNENKEKPSSIEQVAQLLGIKLTREQQLIAANDKGFIPAMEAIGATPEEIASIRRLDREAQGITEKDEQLGEESIQKNRTEKNGITLVKSLTPRFATITDRLHPCKQLLIYTKDELNFYGEGTKLLINNFAELIKEGKAYYGGTGDGFFGMNKNGIVALSGIKSALKKVQEILTPTTAVEEETNDSELSDEPELFQNKSLYSYHIFIFPFKWDNKETTNKAFPERFDLTKIKAKADSSWKHLPNPITTDYATELYNEKNFFYKFVHPVLYDTVGRKDPVILHYERKEAYNYRTLTYEINVIADQRSNRYRLNLTSIGLNLYSTGTGSLMFYLENNDYPDFEDVLRINQFGRRIFPPFLNKITGVIGTKQKELANHIAILGLNGSGHRYFEDFADYTEKTDWKPAHFIESLIDDFDENLEIKPVTDDRMHVLCRYENDKMSRIAKGKWLKNDGFKNDWYRFLFVDGGDFATCTDEKMKKELLKSHTYQRWKGTGALHGMSRYSFVYLADKGAPEYVKDHFRTMYARMVELSLIQRASILKFSEEVTALSKLKQGRTKDLTEKISGLYKEYIRFVNQIYFREVTAQEQGIELYNMLQEKMKIAEQVKDLDGEIEELHNYANLLEQKEQERRITIITVLGAIFLPATFLVGLFGINTMPGVTDLPTFLFSGKAYWPFWISVGFILVVTIILVVAINRKWKLGFKEIFKSNKKR